MTTPQTSRTCWLIRDRAGQPSALTYRSELLVTLPSGWSAEQSTDVEAIRALKAARGSVATVEEGGGK